MQQRQLIVPITTASNTLEPVGGYEYWEIENPSSNTNAVFANINSTATTTATQSSRIDPGTKWYAFVNQKDNPNGVSLIAATGATTVILRKETFRSRIGYGLRVLAGSIAAVVAANLLWRFVSGSTTAIEPIGAIVTARVDTINNKTASTAVLVDGQGTVAVGIGTAAIAGTGATLGEASTRAVRVDSTISGIALIENGTNQFNVVSGQIDVRNNTTFLFFNGNGSDERLGWTPTHSRIGVTGNGASDGVFKTRKFPIKSGSTVAAGELVSLEAGGLNRIRLHVAGDKPLGKVQNGGTGDAGGTVFADVIVDGFDVAAAVADTAGCTEGQYIIPGAVDPTKVQTQATIEGSMGECRKTATSGNATDIYWFGVH